MTNSRIKNFGLLALFLGIPLIPLVIFWFLPMLVSLFISFTDWDYISPTFEFVGFENYSDVLTSDAFYQALGNTVQFSIFTVVPTIVLGFIMALLLNKKLRGQAIYKSMLFTPWVTPMVAVSIVWSWIFEPNNGIVNQLLDFMGIDGPNWLTDSNTAMWVIIIVTIWKQAGWAMLFYSDALSAIPKSLFEVADISGASFWQKLKSIYIPLVSPTTLYLFIISLIDAIQAYDQIDVMTQGGPAGATRTLLYHYYQMAFERFDMGPATAIAMLILVICALLSLLSMWLSKRFVHY